MAKPRPDAPMPPSAVVEPPAMPPQEAKKEEPVRAASVDTAVAAALVLLVEKLGLAELTLEEGVIFITAIYVLANEVARMKVWAPYKQP